MTNLGKSIRSLHEMINKSKVINLNPEFFHNMLINASKKIEYNKSTLESIRKTTYVPGEEDLKFKIGDLEFPNPVGLAAGFLKEPIGLKFWEAFGFGSISIGGITGKAQPGNFKKRVFRLDDGMVNGMGFPSKGVDYVTDMLKDRQKKGMMPTVPFGASLSNNATTKPEDKIAEFKYEMEKLYPYVDFFEINISCPNQAGVCDLGLELDNILKELTAYNKYLASSNGTKRKKLFVKVPPLTQNPENPEDGTIKGLHSIADICNKYSNLGVDAVIATNSIKEHKHKEKTKVLNVSGDIITGGGSGKQIQKVSLNTVIELKKVLNPNIPIIGVGGIGYDEKNSKGQSAVNMINAGAKSLQLYSSFVQDGTFMVVKDIKEALIGNL